MKGKGHPYSPTSPKPPTCERRSTAAASPKYDCLCHNQIHGTELIS